MEHVADSAMDDIEPGAIIKGEIVTIDSEYAYINVGAKSDGGIALEEFDEKPGIGDVIYVMLQSKRLVDGVYQFSKTAADVEKNWILFKESYNQGNLVVKGKIKSVMDKGKIIEFNGMTGFLPFSLSADLKKEAETGRDIEFKIKSVDLTKRSVILSRKDYLDDENRANWESFIQNYKKGDKITGRPVKFVEFGAFVNIKGIDALLHRNDISWKNVFKQRKILKLDQEREFLILDINNEQKKVSLGLKQLSEDPWLIIDEKYKIGDQVTGKVVTITNQGAFVDIGDDIEGFIRNTDLSWMKNSINASNLLAKGEALELMIIDLNKEERKMMLGLKQLKANPWDQIGHRIPVGTIMKRKIRKIMKFGMFVEMEDEIDGFIHTSDISWDDNIKDVPKSFKVDDEVEFKVLEINRDKMRISCGIKQLTKSPWEEIRDRYKPKMVVDGTISGITQFGLFIKLEENLEGLAHISEVSKGRMENLEEHFKIGEQMKALVIGVDVEKKRLSLSIKGYDAISEKEELKKILKSTGSGKVTLGDFVNIKLGDRITNGKN